MIKYLTTISLTICLTISLHGRNFFVSPNGSDSNGDGSNRRPWKSLSFACTRIGPGKNNRLIVAEGSYTEFSPSVIPAGLSIIGAGVGKTIFTGKGKRLEGRGNPFETVGKNLIFINGSNIKLSGFTIDGNDKSLGGGIYIENAFKVEIKELEIKKVHSNGLWVQGSQDLYVHDLEFYDCSWSSSSWAGGALHVGKSKDILFERIKIKEIAQRNGSWGGGLGIKALGGGLLMNVRFSECQIVVNEFGTWQNGKAKNISLELESVDVDGCIIEHSTFNAAVSLVGNNSQRLNGKYEFSVKVAYNNFLNYSGSNSLELSLGHAIIECNYFDVAKGGYAIKNWENTRQENWTIRNNIFWMHSAGWPTCVVGSRAGVHKLVFQNNTIHLTSHPTAIFALYGSNASEEIWIDHNIVIRTASSKAFKEPDRDILLYIKQNEGNHQAKKVSITKNYFYDFPDLIKGPSQEIYNSDNYRENPQLTLSGEKPFPYYSLKPGSSALKMEIGASNP